MAQELETKQQRSVHGIREGQLTTQHRTELGNQVSFLLQKPFCGIHKMFESAYNLPLRHNWVLAMQLRLTNQTNHYRHLMNLCQLRLSSRINPSCQCTIYQRDQVRAQT